MASNFLFQTLGDVGFPTDGADVEDGQLFSVLDPARDRMIALFKAAINYELAHSTTVVSPTSPWGVATAGTVYETRMPVDDTYYEVPDRETLRKGDYRFPFLALYRTELTEVVERTLSIEGQRWRWGLHYCIGELGIANERKLSAVLSAVPKIVQLVIRNNGHPAYADVRTIDGVEQQVAQFFATSGGLAEVRLVGAVIGPASYGEQGQGLVLHAAQLTLETLELDGFVEDDVGAADAPIFEGATFHVNSAATEGVHADTAVIRTEVPVEDPLVTGPPLLGDD